MPPNYQNGKIYAIRAPNTDDIYIGSTTIPLSVRLAQHHYALKRYSDNKTTQKLTSFKLLGLDGHYIELIEEYPCDNKEQLNKREGEVIRITPNCINKFIMDRTIEEWREDNRERLLEAKKKYYQQNKERINNERKSKEGREKDKKYKDANRDKINARRQEIRLIKKILGLQ